MISPFAIFIREERNKKGVTTRNLSEEIGRSPSYISQIERGLIKDVPYSVGLKIIEALGLNKSCLEKYYDLENEDGENNLINGYYIGNETEIDEYRKKFKNALHEHIDLMYTEEMAGLLLLLNNQRDLIYSLSNMSTSVRHDKVTHVLDMIRKYTKFMVQEYKIVEKKEKEEK